MNFDSSQHLNGHNGHNGSNGVGTNGSAPKPNALNDLQLPVATVDPPTLTRRAVLRALVIAPSGKAVAARRVERFLIESGHALRFEQAEAFDYVETARRALSVFDASETPDFLLLDCGSDLSALAALCRRVREALPDAMSTSSIVPVVARNLLNRDDHLWNTLRGTGADALLDADAPTSTLESTLENAAQLSRLNRDLHGAREMLLKHQQIDEVTGLLNRRFFFQAAYREVSRARRYGHPLSCLMLEVDHLVHFNEKNGYACGDAILKTVATMLKSWTRDSDIVARFAGTKMVMLLPETEVDGAVGLREKLLRVSTETVFSYEGTTLPVTLSIGEAARSASVPEPRDEAEIAADANESGVSVREELADLLADADAALYVAKRAAKTPAAFVEYTEGPELQGE